MTTKLTLLAAVLCMAGCAKETPSARAYLPTPSLVSVAESWEHGWKTKSVIATRYKNRDIGYNIGFKYPGHEYDCDRAEIRAFIESKGGFVYQSGGSPGAEMFVVFYNVTDKDTADAKLKEILPGLDRVIKSL